MAQKVYLGKYEQYASNISHNYFYLFVLILFHPLIKHLERCLFKNWSQNVPIRIIWEMNTSNKEENIIFLCVFFGPLNRCQNFTTVLDNHNSIYN